MRKHLSTIILILVFVIGLSLLLYPTLSDYWNSFHQSRAISDYAETVADLDNDLYMKMLNEAREYNKSLVKESYRYLLSEEDKKEYNSLLDIGDGVMGYIEIPSIKCALPIYHGTDEAVLQVAIGHIEGSSLPIGGIGTHSVLSGHRGLPSAKLFTNLDQLIEGDVFLIRVLDETITYEVDQILIVLPDEIDSLDIDENMDYCTLITCTPYGVNTHRLLVRGHRIDNLENASEIRVTADAMQIDPVIVAPIVSIPILLLLLAWLLMHNRKK